MDFEPTAEQKAFREKVRRFAEGVIRPKAADLDAGRGNPAEILMLLGREKWMGVVVPEEDGGCGRDNVSYVLALTEVSKACASTGALLFAHNSLYCFPLVAHGTPEQKKKLLHRCSSGEFAGCFALSEQGAGSDPAHLGMTALKAGSTWTLNGEKSFVTGGNLASFCILPALTGREKGEGSLSLFVVDLREAQGFKVGRVEETLGMRAAGTAQLLFQDVRVSEEALLGDQGRGLVYLKTLRAKGWAGTAAQALGIGRAALEEALREAKGTGQRGKPHLSSQTTQWKLADMAVELDASELLVVRAAWLDDCKKSFEKEAAMARMFACDAAMKASLEGVQILGEKGFTKENPMERHLRDAKVCQVYQGTGEMVHSVVASHLVRGTRGNM